MSGHPAAVPPSGEFPPPHSITSSARGEKPRPHRGFFLGSNRVRTSPTWSASRVQPSPLSHVGPLVRGSRCRCHAGPRRRRSRMCRARPGGLGPCLLRTPTRHRSMGDSRAVGSKEKGGRTWNQSSCRKLWLRQLLGRTVMTQTISELLMLTCCGAFIASVTYAVKLSIEAF